MSQVKLLLKRGQRTCCLCKFSFYGGHSLRRHLKGVHEVDVLLETDSKPRPHKCFHCEKAFIHSSGRRRHVRHAHKDLAVESSSSAQVDLGWSSDCEPNEVGRFSCKRCQFLAETRETLKMHYKECHHPDLASRERQITFETYEDFMDFKEDLEYSQPSFFVKWRMVRQSTSDYVRFNCSRQPRRIGILRKNRTDKMDAPCTAYFKARIDSEGVHVSYVKEHTHECDASKIPLSENQRQLLTSWFRGGLTTNRILDNCKTRGERDRMFYLQRDEVNSMRRKYLKESQRLNNDTMEAVNELLVALDKRSSENPRSETLRKAKTQLEQVASKMSKQHDAFMEAKRRLSKTEFAIAYPGIRFRKTETEQHKSAQDGEAVDSP